MGPRNSLSPPPSPDFAIFDNNFENYLWILLFLCLSLTNWVEKGENENLDSGFEKRGLLSSWDKEIIRCAENWWIFIESA